MTSSRTPAGLRIPVRVLPHGRGLGLPAYQTAGSAGLDLVAAVPADAPLELAAMQRALVPTGLVLALPSGVEAQVRPRSGLALRHGITVLNSPGTIDSDYRGELMVLLVNLGAGPWLIERGERIAQLVVSRFEQAELVAARDVGATKRGAGGFGSTGRGPATGPGGREHGVEPAPPAAGNKNKTSRAPRARAKPVARRTP